MPMRRRLLPLALLALAGCDTSSDDASVTFHLDGRSLRGDGVRALFDRDYGSGSAVLLLDLARFDDAHGASVTFYVNAAREGRYSVQPLTQISPPPATERSALATFGVGPSDPVSELPSHRVLGGTLDLRSVTDDVVRGRFELAVQARASGEPPQTLTGTFRAERSRFHTTE